MANLSFSNSKTQSDIFKSAKVLVVGEPMLDKYWLGNTTKISPEAPVPVVHINETNYQCGGAANAAANIVSLGANSSLCGVVGNDSSGDILRRIIAKHGVNDLLMTKKNISTIIRTRVISVQQQLIRLDFNRQGSSLNCTKISEKTEAELKRHNLLLICDYGKDTLSNVHKILQCARNLSIPVVVKSTGSNLDEYQGVDILVISNDQLGAISQTNIYDKKGVEKLNNLKINLNIAALVCHDNRGLTLLLTDNRTVYFGTHTDSILDVTGTNDTLAAVLSAAFASGIDIHEACEFAHVAAEFARSKIGTSMIEVENIFKSFHSNDS